MRRTPVARGSYDIDLDTVYNDPSRLDFIAELEQRVANDDRGAQFAEFTTIWQSARAETIAYKRLPQEKYVPLGPREYGTVWWDHYAILVGLVAAIVGPVLVIPDVLGDGKQFALPVATVTAGVLLIVAVLLMLASDRSRVVTRSIGDDPRAYMISSAVLGAVGVALAAARVVVLGEEASALVILGVAAMCVAVVLFVVAVFIAASRQRKLVADNEAYFAPVRAMQARDAEHIRGVMQRGEPLLADARARLDPAALRAATEWVAASLTAEAFNDKERRLALKRAFGTATLMCAANPESKAVKGERPKKNQTPPAPAQKLG